MYNTHFNFNESPFTLTPDTRFFCHLKSHEEAFTTILVSLKNSEGFVKVTGPVGTGKTMLCRRILDALEDKKNEFVVAYIPNPLLPAIDLYRLIIHELEGKLEKDTEIHEVHIALNTLLLDLKKQGKRPVLVVDEAQVTSDEGLEAIRLLTNLETETLKLLQVVLFGQSELDDRLNSPKFLHLKQRIIFSAQLKPLNHKEFLNYVQHRIAKAGYLSYELFEKKALHKIFRASGGIPRMANILCHKSLIAAYSRSERVVTKKSAKIAIKDTLQATKKKALFFSRPTLEQSILLFLLCGLALIVGYVV